MEPMFHCHARIVIARRMKKVKNDKKGKFSSSKNIAKKKFFYNDKWAKERMKCTGGSSDLLKNLMAGG